MRRPRPLRPAPTAGGPPMRITSDEGRRIAAPAQLQVSPEEVSRLGGELDRILDDVNQLAQVNVDGVEPSAAPPVDRSGLREDRPAGSLTTEEALSNAPDADRDHFRVPRVIG